MAARRIPMGRDLSAIDLGVSIAPSDTDSFMEGEQIDIVRNLYKQQGEDVGE